MFRAFLWLVGGLCCAVGVLSLLFSFETPFKNPELSHFSNDIGVTLSSVGWDAVADVTTTGAFPLAVIGIGIGLPILVGLNATAWRSTGGY
jgi:hypothetical protein